MARFCAATHASDAAAGSKEHMGSPDGIRGLFWEVEHEAHNGETTSREDDNDTDDNKKNATKYGSQSRCDMKPCWSI
jgi:hypothetical protein